MAAQSHSGTTSKATTTAASALTRGQVAEWSPRSNGTAKQTNVSNGSKADSNPTWVVSHSVGRATSLPVDRQACGIPCLRQYAYQAASMPMTGTRTARPVAPLLYPSMAPLRPTITARTISVLRSHLGISPPCFAVSISEGRCSVVAELGRSQTPLSTPG